MWNAHKPWHVLFVSLIFFCNSKTQERKGLIVYNTKNGITTLEKQSECKPFYYCKSIWGGNK
jgi:hypothetical protein